MSDGQHLQPLEIAHERDHRFARREEGRRGCDVCGGARAAMVHVGTPQTMNFFGSGAHYRIYQGMKHAWQDRLTELLRAADLPRGLGGVLVEGRLTFPTRQRRDQGNYRYLLEKALGDTLTAGGWLEDDDWSRYEFGNLQARYEKGVSRTELIIFPRALVVPEPDGGQGALL